MPITHPKSRLTFLAQEILNFAARDLNADDTPDCLDVNIIGATFDGGTLPLPVTIVGGGTGLPSSSVRQPGSALTVAGNTQTTILTYTNLTKVLWLDGFVATGTVQAEFVLVINNVPIIYHRTSHMQRTAHVPIVSNSQMIAINDVIDIKVTHWYGAVADFYATLLGHKF